MHTQNLIANSFAPYSFNGMEHDNEVKGEGNSVNYKFRWHDTRVGRFFTADPLEKQFTSNSPFAFSENQVIANIDLEGLEKFYTADGNLIGKYGDNEEIRIVNNEHINAMENNFKQYMDDPTGFSMSENATYFTSTALSEDVSYHAEDNMDKAAIQWAQRYMPMSILENIEYGAELFETKINDKIYYTYSEPQKGTESMLMTLRSENAVGDIHTHGPYDPDYSGDEFSDDDILTYVEGQITGYVATPIGKLLKYDPVKQGRTLGNFDEINKNKEVEVVSGNSPSDPNHPRLMNFIDRVKKNLKDITKPQ